MSDQERRLVHCVRSDTFAGVERYVANVAPELARRGWDVCVIGGDPSRMRAELGAIRHTRATTTRALATKLLRFNRNTIVHAHMTAAEAAAVSARTLRRFSLVATRHFAAPRGSTRIARVIAPLIRRSLDRQISASRFVAESIREPSIVILNGVPATDQSPVAEHMVLVAQRLEREKHTEIALEAWARSNLRSCGWRLAIAGSGRQAGELAEIVEHLGLGASVDFVGVQADMSSLMSRTAIFFATAPAEPFGFGVVEAMAAGVPVIAARAGGHRETSGAVSARWLFRVDDSAAAAAMLDALGADLLERQRYGAALQAWQRENLSIEAHVDQLEAVYAEISR